ncbi:MULTISPECIES: acyl-CoA thioesterase [unclassified Arsukibacterium]|uniref:acyl-CoA thioesterase n=1 Tax=unclassified Arsukibacterium TaxID=2635278 RepID=UPI000C634228|nr:MULTISPECIES: acyl-CoA thioesterase [unclassified Arsukibacterium]MAA93895.1 acyl-CoA thioesterase [Rheinheimera sp.]MBM33346.1 acyl-CoA thioesterase [Rheinheimera sp.]HAW91325.1 acyl-CoA thioesterase [Candidatus Azambacteria bacterium]|tara:strand:- start:469 stop:885 length:417 start_codon:yes stop_codon:yes gene_type:complete
MSNTPPSEALIAKRMAHAVTRVTKTVFPGRTNHHNTLFGGEALAWMDEAAFIAATRFCRKPLVTVCSDRVDFKESIPAGTIIELVARVEHVGRTSIKVHVDIFVENMYSDDQHKAISGNFTFVALDSERKPTPVLADF